MEKKQLDIIDSRRSVHPRQVVWYFAVYYLFAFTVFFVFLKNDVFFHTPLVDEVSNVKRASDLVSGQLGEDLFWQEGGTYIYFGVLKRLGLDSPVKIKVFQIFFLHPFTGLLFLILGVRFFKMDHSFPVGFFLFYPVLVFFSMTMMKTSITILLYLLCFFFFFQFMDRKGSLKSGLLFLLFFSLSWWTRQHIILFLPVFFYFLSRRSGDLPPVEKRNVLRVFVLVCLIIVGSLSILSLLAKNPLRTLTTNGSVNFYISNNANVGKTLNIWPGPEWKYLNSLLINHQIRPLEYVKANPVGWLALLGKKAIWEFTPRTYFRQYNWGYYVKIFPYFFVNNWVNFVLISLSLFCLIRWRKLDDRMKVAALCWTLFHVINIVFIPGIARYNAVISFLTILLAYRGWRLLVRQPKHIIACLVFPLLIFWIKVPNDFGKEYWDYIGAQKQLLDGKKLTVTIPGTTQHPSDWTWIEGWDLFNRKQYADALRVIQTNIPRYHLYGDGVNNIVNDSLLRLGLYYDQLLFLNAFDESAPEIKKRKMALRYQILYQTEGMVQSYREAGLWNWKKITELSDLISRLPPPGNPQDSERYGILLNLAVGWIHSEIDDSSGDPTWEHYDLLGVFLARLGKLEESREAFTQAHQLITDPEKKEQYQKERHLPIQ